MSLDDVIKFVDKLGTLPLLSLVVIVVIVVIYVFYKRWLVLGPFYFDLELRLGKTETQRDQAIDMAAKLTDILEAGRRGTFRGR